MSEQKNLKFDEEEVEAVLNELDPYFSDIIMIARLRERFKDEIHFHSISSFNRPTEIISIIRGKVFPKKKLAMQQALVDVDNNGDGYINLEAFVKAFKFCQVEIDVKALEFLFNSFAEEFGTDGKALSVNYFLNKIFNDSEMAEFNKVDETLSKVKASMIYKGINYTALFADTQDEEELDLTKQVAHYQQQLLKSEFCRRVESLEIPSLSSSEIIAIANFLALNRA
jgi:hypothetical protein